MSNRQLFQKPWQSLSILVRSTSRGPSLPTTGGSAQTKYFLLPGLERGPHCPVQPDAPITHPSAVKEGAEGWVMGMQPLGSAFGLKVP